MAITEERKGELLREGLLRSESARIIDGALVIFDVNDPPAFVENPLSAGSFQPDEEVGPGA